MAYAAKTGSQLWAARYPAGSGALFDALAVSPDRTRVFVTVSTLTGSCNYRPISAYATVAYRTR